MTTLTPAYGRDYKTKKDVLHDLYAGLDFILNNILDPYDGKPCSPMSDLSGQQVKVRYSRLTKVFILNIPAASGSR